MLRGRTKKIIILGSTALAYMIVAILYIFHIGTGKTLLICSIMSFLIGLFQLAETIILGLQKMELNIYNTSLCGQFEWNKSGEKKDSSETIKINNQYREDQKQIVNTYERIIKKIQWSEYIILSGTVIGFIVMMIYLPNDGNSRVADVVSLFAFSILFFSLTVQAYIKEFVDEISVNIKEIVEGIENRDGK